MSDNQILKENSYGERYIESINARDFENSRSRDLFHSTFDDALFHSKMLYVIVGSDSGLLPRYIESIGVPKHSEYWFVEPENLLSIAEENARVQSPNLRFMTFEEATRNITNSTDASVIYHTYKEQVVITKSLGCRNPEQTAYFDYHDKLLQLQKYFGYKVITSIYSRPFLEVTVANSSYAKDPISHLQNKFADRSAVILAAGPSLDKHIDWIRSRRSDLLLIAISRVSKTLLEAGITPDIAVTADPKYRNFEQSKEVLLVNPALLAFCTYATPFIVRQYSGRKAYIGNRLPWSSKLNQPNCPEAGPTVTNTSIEIAAYLGCRQIVLIGADSCFSQEGSLYASQETQKTAKFGHSGALIPVTTNIGAPAYSTDDYVWQAEAISEQAKRLAQNGTALITPAENALAIEWVKFVPEGQIQISPSETSAADIISNCFPDSSDQAYLDTLESELIRAKKSLQQVRTKASKLVREINQALEKSAGLSEKLLQRIGSLGDQINSEFITPCLQEKYSENFLEISLILKYETESPERDLRQQKALFSGFSESAGDLLSIISSHIDHIEVRRQELSESPNIKNLISEWTSSEQPGRAVNWMIQHPVAANALPEHLSSKLNKLKQSFYGMFDSAEDKDPAPTPALFEHDIPKIQQAFQQKDKDLLQFMAQSLSRVEESSIAVTDYLHLIQGMLLELDSEYEQAMRQYYDVIQNQQSPVLLYALERIAQLSFDMGNVADGLNALECLTHITDEYKPTFASALASTGQLDDAATVYQSYLENHDDEYEHFLHLAEIYIQMTKHDLARETLKRVLNNDPGNPDAEKLLSSLP